MKSYQFTLLRYNHNWSAGELVNIGIVMWIPADRRLLHMVNQRYGRLSSFYPGFDGAGYRQMVRRLVQRLTEVSTELVDPQLLLGESPSVDLLTILQRTLPEDASCLQWGHIMGGIAKDPVDRLEQLRREFVERHESRAPLDEETHASSPPPSPSS